MKLRKKTIKCFDYYVFDLSRLIDEKLNMIENVKIYCIYNAEGSIFGELKYLYNKYIRDIKCSMCDITHNTLSEKREWKKRVESQEYLDVMMSCNPTLIPRNYLVEEALSEAETDGKFEKFNELNEIISSPYQLKKVNIKYLETPSKTNIPYKTFCGT